MRLGARPALRAVGLRRAARDVVVFACAVIASAGPGPLAPVPAAFAAPSCVQGWQSVGLPDSLTAMQINGAAAVGNQPGWVVGLATAKSDDARVPLIGQWVNGAWVKVASPWTNYGSLNAVATTSSTNAWTVGAIGSYTRWPISARWSGSSWTRVSVPRPSGSQLSVFTDLAITSADRFWAVGDRLVNGLLKPLAMVHQADGTWLTRNPGVAATGEGGLTDVTVAPGGRVWIGGWKTDANGQGRPWVAYRSGTSWITSALAALPAGRAAITDLSFNTASDGWAVGFAESVGGYVPLLQHWNGTSWAGINLPWAAGRSIVLNAVDADGGGRLIVGGMQIDQLHQDLFAVRDGSTWTVSSVSPGTDQPASIADTTRFGSAVMLAGFSNHLPVTLFPCTSSTQPSRAAPDDKPASASSVLDDDGSSGPGPVRDTFTGPSVAVAGTVAQDMTVAAGLARSAPTWGGVAADFSGDGRTDLFINRHFQDVPLLMINSAAGVFSAGGAKLAQRDRHRCAAADIDGNGQLDLFCTIGVNKGTSNTADELQMNVGTSGGSWATDDYGVADGYGRGRDAVFLNLDGDGRPDLFVVNEASRSDGMWSSDRLFKNVGGSTYVSSPEWGVDHSMGGSCAVAGDVNGDGRDDLLVCAQEPYAGQGAGVRLFMNESGKLVNRTAAAGLAPKGETELELADFNGDGRLDLALLNSSGLRVMTGSNGTFTKSFELQASGGVAMATGDVNGDGHPDIYVSRRTTGNAGHLMLVNGGDGSAFVSMTIPEPGAGQADDVLPIDYDGNGRTDFVTLNGWNGVNGPIKLTAFFPQ